MTGFRPGTSPPPVRMAILSLGGTGMNLLRFFRDAQELDAYLHAGRKRLPELTKSLRANAALSYRLRGKALGPRQSLSRGSTVKAAAKPPHSKCSRIVSHKFG